MREVRPSNRSVHEVLKKKKYGNMLSNNKMLSGNMLSPNIVLSADNILLAETCYLLNCMSSAY
jgi:hypothetical protein